MDHQGRQQELQRQRQQQNQLPFRNFYQPLTLFIKESNIV